jgi:hypothetical protein
MQRTLEVAYEAAGWQALVDRDEQKNRRREERIVHPNSVGIRASEHLTYSDFPSLSEHTDGSTAYTMNFAFSGADDYDGGEFFIVARRNKKAINGQNVYKEYLKPNKYDAMVFLGGRYLHGVNEIKGGHREMFSTEFWPYPDTPFGSTLWSNIPDNILDHIRTCNEEKANGNDGPCKAEFPKSIHRHESLEEVQMKYNSVDPYEVDPRGPPTVPGINRTKDDVGEYNIGPMVFLAVGSLEFIFSCF